ncbi:copper amine oxidase N-terminal domain-containing protein [Brassicibacter mesophilus]|uniref:copper amine oxidase N-terminal domain-containing protein n=1 Tax=Brassicibacter mesophilus TaxID=745119 RepID=UPI003D1C009D
MKRAAKVIGTLSIALVMTSTVSPGLASAQGDTLVPVLISAQGDALTPDKIAYESNKEELDYMRVEGTIKEVRSHEGKLSILVQNGDEEGSGEMVFNISDELLIINQSSKDSFDKKELKEGLKIEAFYRKDVPMIMVYPPQISPDLLIINSEDEAGSIEYSRFNEELVNEDNSLKLNISDETSIVSQYGEKLTKEELSNKELVVFYTITTRSIPAQTNPEKIIVLEHEESSEEDNSDEIDDLIKDDIYYKDEIKMIPLRKVAEHLGYKVEWKNETRSAILTKRNSSFSVSIGKKEYGFNKSLRQFEIAPEIKNNNAYVPDSLLELLK